MPYPRKALVSPETTPYYHCISRCVRRAFLCGFDRITGNNYDHRKQWVVDRLALLTHVFTIDVCAYAVMSNHHHVVVKIDKPRAEGLSDQAVAERWSNLFDLPDAVWRYVRGEPTDCAEVEAARAALAAYRSRLSDLSWFMRCLNESIARQANAEDGCTGRFWEGRFKSQALLDEAALLSCMSYVDLNPVRAQLAETPEESDFTSIQARIEAWQQAQSLETARPPAEDLRAAEAPGHLLPFRGPDHRDAPDHLPFTLTDYLALVDWGGRALRADKRGAIPEDLPPILTRLNIDPVEYLAFLRARRNRFSRAIGGARQLRAAARRAGQSFFRGIGAGEALFPQPG